MRQADDTAGSQYGFRRRDAPSADLCVRISAVGSVTPRGTCFGSSYLVHGTRPTAAIGAHRPLLRRSTNAEDCPLAAIKGATEQRRGRVDFCRWVSALRLAECALARGNQASRARVVARAGTARCWTGLISCWREALTT